MLLNILQAEWLLFKRRVFVYIVPLAGLVLLTVDLLRTYGAINGPLSQAVLLNGQEVDWQAALYWLTPQHSFQYSVFLLAGQLTLLLFLFVGIAWNNDEIRFNIVHLLPVTQKRTGLYLFGKLLSLAIYIFLTLLFLAGWGALFSRTFEHIMPGGWGEYLTVVNAKSLGAGFIVLYFWALAGFAFNLVLRSAVPALAVSGLFRLGEPLLAGNIHSPLVAFLPWVTGYSLLLRTVPQDVSPQAGTLLDLSQPLSTVILNGRVEPFLPPAGGSIVALGIWGACLVALARLGLQLAISHKGFGGD